MIRLGLNIDHVATLRQVRGGLTDYPDVLKAAKLCIKAGADQITIHLRGDRRHIQEFDLKNLTKNKIPINFEMAATKEMTAFALKYKPQIVCLVPEKREELTTEGGLNVIKNYKKIRKCIDQIKKTKIKVSLFIEPKADQIIACSKLGADAVEFHTGKYALAKSQSKKQQELLKLKKACILAHSKGLSVHAGHGLDYKNVKAIKKLPYLEELNIGHSVISYSIYLGIEKAVREMKKCLR